MSDRLVTFNRELIPPAAPLYIGRDDRIMIRTHNSLSGAVVGVRGRFQAPGGDVAPFDVTLTPTADRAITLSEFALAEGFLYSIIAFPSVGAPRRGQTFVELDILRGVRGAAAGAQVLVKDYITAGHAIGWPGGRPVSSVEGPGMLRSVAGTDPAAAAEVQETVPTNARWILHGMTVALVTDANAANRQVHLVLDDGTNTVFRSVAASVQTASLTHNYNIGAHGISSAVVALEQFIPIPSRFPLFQAWRINTETDNIQAADNYGAPRLMVEEWIED